MHQYPGQPRSSEYKFVSSSNDGLFNVYFNGKEFEFDVSQNGLCITNVSLGSYFTGDGNLLLSIGVTDGRVFKYLLNKGDFSCQFHSVDVSRSTFESVSRNHHSVRQRVAIAVALAGLGIGIGEALLSFDESQKPPVSSERPTLPFDWSLVQFYSDSTQLNSTSLANISRHLAEIFHCSVEDFRMERHGRSFTIFFEKSSTIAFQMVYRDTTVTATVYGSDGRFVDERLFFLDAPLDTSSSR